MNIAEIESSLRELVEEPFDMKEFAYRFLEIYDAPKATIAKLRATARDDLLMRGEMLWKKKLFYRAAEKGGVAAAIEEMAKVEFSKKDAPRYLLSTDGIEAIARDTKTDRSVDLPHDRLVRAFVVDVIHVLELRSIGGREVLGCRFGQALIFQPDAVVAHAFRRDVNRECI